MNWFNYYGLIILVIMMIPNLIFSVKCKDGFINYWDVKIVQMFEQIGRFGSFGFMVFNIPGTYFDFWIDNGIIVYSCVNGILLLAYCIIWIFCFNKNSIFKAFSLSIIPSIIFLFSGIMISSVLLIISAAIFAPAHIAISYKNARYMLDHDIVKK